MIIKSFNQSLMALLLIAMPVMGADKRQIVTFNMPKHATVADVICSEHNGHVGFNMPLAPQFTHRGLFRSFPKGMSEYPAYYPTEAGRLTTAAMVRFIEQSPSLFTDEEEQAIYKEVLADAVTAHKKAYAAQTLYIKETEILLAMQRVNLKNPGFIAKFYKALPTNMSIFLAEYALRTRSAAESLDALHQAEDKVFSQLKRLSVNTPETRTLLENILSSPRHNVL